MTHPLPAADGLPPPEEPDRRAPSVAQVVFGGLLVLVGILWLLEALGVADVPWQIVLPIALMAVGGGLVAGAATGIHGGLVAAGLLLTLVLAVGSSLGPLADLPFTGGFGEREFRPQTVDEVRSAYRLSVGDMELDLRGIRPAAGRPLVIEASVGIGRLTVRVPEAVNVQGVAKVAAGNVVTFGDEAGGVSVEQQFGTLTAGVDRSIELELNVGLGEIVVTR